MKTIVSFLSAGLLVLSTNAQVDSVQYWDCGGVFSLNFTQTSLTNWAAGGQNAVSGNGLLSVFSNYKKDNIAWENTLDLAYGLLKQDEEDLRKTDDRIDFNSKFSLKATEKLFYSAALNFRSQWAPGYSLPNDSVKISDWLAPAYIVVALGIDYKLADYFSLFLGPLTGKITIVNDQTLADAGAFGVDPAEFDGATKVADGKNVRGEFGGNFRASFNKELMENVTLTSRLDLFSNYANNPQNIDVNWEALLALKVNKFITATVSTQLLYDHDILIGKDTDGDNVDDSFSPRTQFKEVLGIGLSYKF